MDEKFLFGVVLGMLGGAIIATNSSKARQVVRDGQQQIKQKAMEMANKNQSEE